MKARVKSTIPERRRENSVGLFEEVADAWLDHNGPRSRHAFVKFIGEYPKDLDDGTVDDLLNWPGWQETE